MKYLFITMALSLMASTGFAQTALEVEKKLSQEYLTKMQAEPNAKVLDRGVIIRKVYESHTKEFPMADSKVKVLYEGFDREGKVFDSAFARDTPATFPLSGLIACWKIAIPEISVGSVYKITCPSDTAYGDKGASTTIKGGAALSFRLIVLELMN